MKNLIVNADDLGWTEGVNRGIVEAHRRGLVTSTSLLANGRAFESALAAAISNPQLGIGVHLNLSDGPPSAPADEVRGLLNEAGIVGAAIAASKAVGTGATVHTPPPSAPAAAAPPSGSASSN